MEKSDLVEKIEKSENEKLEKDAAPIPTIENRSLSCSDASDITEVIENIPDTMNSMVLRQTNTSTVLKFDNCQGVHFGNLMNIGWSPGNCGNAIVPVEQSEEYVYRKTPTIKSMLESSDPISSPFLDAISGNFGLRWKDVTILLQINQLFVDRMYEDYFERGGTKEVVFQVLQQYLKDHEDKDSVGWLVTFLWRNGFKKTVWSVKDHYKKLKELEKEFD